MSSLKQAVKVLWRMPFPRIGSRSDELDEWIDQLNLIEAYYAGFASVVLGGRRPSSDMDFKPVVSLREEFDRIKSLGEDETQKLETCERYLIAVEAVALALKAAALGTDDTGLPSSEEAAACPSSEVVTATRDTATGRPSSSEAAVQKRVMADSNGSTLAGPYVSSEPVMTSKDVGRCEVDRAFSRLLGTPFPTAATSCPELSKWLQELQNTYRGCIALVGAASLEEAPIYPVDVLGIDVADIVRLREGFNHLASLGRHDRSRLCMWEECLRALEAVAPALKQYVEKCEHKHLTEEE